jgi:hypothetical protein
MRREKKNAERNEKAEAMGEKEWLWIQLVRAISREMRNGKLKGR